MNDKFDSLIEIALREMSKKRKSKTLKDICKDVFEIKGIESTVEIETQFRIDFMLSGYFVCCGEDARGEKLWDLKCRQPSSLLDKDGHYLEDLYEDDEEVKANELNENNVYNIHEQDEDYNYHDEDDEEEKEEKDDIEEEIEMNGGGYTTEDEILVGDLEDLEDIENE